MRVASWKLFAVTLGAALWMPAASMRAQAPAVPGAPAGGDVVIKPTNHPRLPRDPSDVWLVPSKPLPRTAVVNEFVTAVKLEVDSNFARALPILSQSAIQEGVLGHYATYYQGLAELRLGRPADARRTFQSLAAKRPVGYLVEAVALREAECAEAVGDQSGAMEIYSRLAATKTTAPDDLLMRLGRSARAAGNLDRATDAFQRIVYEFPVQRPGARRQQRTRIAAARADCPRQYALQAGAGTGRAPVRR